MQFITFVDSRKQTEYLAAITDRKERKQDDEDVFSEIPKLDIYPYRAGYEESDRNAIQKQLTEGSLRGVISTSALEMGIDIPSLNLAILSGVPSSATSFLQRVGRIGRHQRGMVLVINDGSVVSETIFANPELIDNMPLTESALYLENRYVQYIHALCLARHGGEDELVSGSASEASDFTSPVSFPADFLALCQAERVGEIPSDLQSMKGRAGDSPNHAFPLRDIEPQYKVENKQSPDGRLGNLSFSQLLREAYPGAVYYYQARPYRVYKIREREKLVEVRREKSYFTSPSMLPTMIFPNLTEGNVYGALKCNALTLIEANLQVRESLCGFKERRGPNEFVVSYPLDRALSLFFDQPRLTRNFFTSGVLIEHPSLDRRGVEVEQLERILFEAFLMVIPFERRDISAGSGRFKVSRDLVQEGARFICIYDETFGSLRLTSRLLSEPVIRAVFERAMEVARTHAFQSLTVQSLTALEDLVEAAAGGFEDLLFPSDHSTGGAERELVIMPGSVGLDTRRNNEEFFVEAVFYSPQEAGLVYRGKHLSELNTARASPGKHGPVTILAPAKAIVPVPGESKLGAYSFETGEITATDV
jgi:DEAD/DEAH box helicase domain-containing protein